jgi:hypothetical protein
MAHSNASKIAHKIARGIASDIASDIASSTKIAQAKEETTWPVTKEIRAYFGIRTIRGALAPTAATLATLAR